MRSTLSSPCVRRERQLSTEQWARSLTAQPAWVVAASHGFTLNQAIRLQALLPGFLEDEAGR